MVVVVVVVVVGTLAKGELQERLLTKHKFKPF
jgi:hypothetical protein